LRAGDARFGEQVPGAGEQFAAIAVVAICLPRRAAMAW
jgi:hypothetical protein